MTRIILDTGPLVAYFNSRDTWHLWAVEQMKALAPPLLTCEPVLTEACFLIHRAGGDAAKLVRALREGVLAISLNLQQETVAVEALLTHYADTSMSLADACLVRLAELYADSRIFTVDSDFRHYRRNRRQLIPLLYPKH